MNDKGFTLPEILIGLAICYGIRYINNNVKNKEK